MEEKKAQFRLLDFKVEHSHFDIDKDNIKEEETNFSINIGRQYGINEEERLFRLGLIVQLKDDNNAVNISVEIAGFFEFDSDLDDQSKNNFFHDKCTCDSLPSCQGLYFGINSFIGI